MAKHTYDTSILSDWACAQLKRYGHIFTTDSVILYVFQREFRRMSGWHMFLIVFLDQKQVGVTPGSCPLPPVPVQQLDWVGEIGERIPRIAERKG